MKKISTLSPVTPPNSSDKIGNCRGNLPKSKLVRRLTRSMAKAKMVKTPVSNKVPVETVVIDDEEIIAPSPVIDNLVHPESVADLASEGHPVIDNDMC